MILITNPTQSTEYPMPPSPERWMHHDETGTRLEPFGSAAAPLPHGGDGVGPAWTCPFSTEQ